MNNNTHNKHTYTTKKGQGKERTNHTHQSSSESNINFKKTTKRKTQEFHAHLLSPYPFHPYSDLTFQITAAAVTANTTTAPAV